MKSSRSLLTLSAVSVLLAAAACGGDKSPPKSEFPALGQPARLKLLSAGAEPKTPLRWRPKLSTPERLVMRMDMKTEIEVSGQTVPVNVKMTMDTRASVKEVKPDGSAVVAMKLVDVSMEMPDMGGAGAGADAGQRFKELLTGMTITATIDPRGVASDAKIDSDDPMIQQIAGNMSQSLSEMSIPFPEEAVGLGAKWQALTTQRSNGMKLRMVATYELVALDGDHGRAKMTLRQFADKQTMTMQGGVEAQLNGLSSTGSGDMSFDLTKPMIAEASIQLKLDADLEMMGQRAAMKVDAHISLDPKR